MACRQETSQASGLYEYALQRQIRRKMTPGEVPRPVFGRGQCFRRADLLGVDAPGMKVASRRRVGRIGMSPSSTIR